MIRRWTKQWLPQRRKKSERGYHPLATRIHHPFDWISSLSPGGILNSRQSIAPFHLHLFPRGFVGSSLHTLINKHQHKLNKSIMREKIILQKTRATWKGVRETYLLLLQALRALFFLQVTDTFSTMKLDVAESLVRLANTSSGFVALTWHLSLVTWTVVFCSVDVGHLAKLGEA